MTIHASELTPDLRDLIERQPIYAGTLVLAYNPGTRRIERIHPATGGFEAP